MPTPQGCIEVYSAVEDDPDITEACRVLSVNGICDTCGSEVDRLHATLICHGWYCADHCLVCTGAVSISDVEREAIFANRIRSLPLRKRLALMAHQQWSNPVIRERMKTALRAATAEQMSKARAFHDRVLHVDESFCGPGSVLDLIRDLDGQTIRALRERAQNAALSLVVLFRVVKQGIADGTLTVD